MGRAILAVAEVPYRVGVGWRNWRYDTRPGLVTRLGVPVVSVGNLSLGGTGKTPMVKWLAKWFETQGVRPTILSRGYGAESGEKNDEAMELEDCLPKVPHLQNRNRVMAGQQAIDEQGAQLLLLDDGFQHQRLARDLDMVLLDATEPFGYGRLFPRGALREPVGSLRRADVVCLTRSDLVSCVEREQIRERVTRVSPNALWCESVCEPVGLLGDHGKWTLDQLRGKRVAAFCGVGNPLAFVNTVEGLGVEIVSFIEMEDHHSYSVDDLRLLGDQAKKHGADLMLCTHKDMVKVRTLPQVGVPILAVEIGATITEGLEPLECRLSELARVASIGSPSVARG